ncbi:MAG: hypothetical protein IPM59_12715 [Chloracidobacterium sp.]|nr:hypothetical protein [Chloracidobacterium sp.]
MASGASRRSDLHAKPVPEGDALTSAVNSSPAGTVESGDVIVGLHPTLLELSLSGTFGGIIEGYVVVIVG